MRCIHCGREIEDDNQFCPFCGKELIPEEVAVAASSEVQKPAPVKKKSKKPLLITLCLLLVAGAAFAVTGFLYPGFMKTAVEVYPENLVGTVWVDQKDGAIVYDEVGLDQDVYDGLVAIVENSADKARVSYFLDSLEFVPDKTKDLSVGDELTFTVKYDEEELKEINRNLRFRISVAQEPFTYVLDSLPDRSYVGVWRAVKFEAYGVTMTPEEADLTFSVDVREDGTITATTNGEDDGSGTWQGTGNGIRIDSAGSSYNAVIKGKQLVLNMEGIKFYLVRE